MIDRKWLTWPKLNCAALAVWGQTLINLTNNRIPYFKDTHQDRKVIALIRHRMSGPFFQTRSCTNLLPFVPLQDDCSTAGMFDPILATLEVHPLPAEALEGVQTRTGRSQEGCHETSPAAAEERLTWVSAPAQTRFVMRCRHRAAAVFIMRAFSAVWLPWLKRVFTSVPPASRSPWKRSSQSWEWSLSSDQKTQVPLRQRTDWPEQWP